MSLFHSLIPFFFLIINVSPETLLFETIKLKDAKIIEKSEIFDNHFKIFDKNVNGTANYNMCETKAIDLNGDTTKEISDSFLYTLDTLNCGKNFTILLFRNPLGYQVDASLNGTKIDLFKDVQNNLTSLLLPPGQLIIQITQLESNVTSFHMLVFGDTFNYSIHSSTNIQPDIGPWTVTRLKAGDKGKYLIYQGSSLTSPMQVGTEISVMGDCPIRLWKGYNQIDSAFLYGGIGTICGRNFYRSVIPRFVFDRYLIVETDGTSTSDCNVTVHTVKLNSTRNINSADVLTFPAWTVQTTDQSFTYHLANIMGPTGINLNLMTPLPTGTTLTIDDQTGSGKRNITDCSFHTDSLYAIVEYSWKCSPGLSCDEGPLLRYSVGSDDFFSTTPSPSPTSPQTTISSATSSTFQTTTKTFSQLKFIISFIILIVSLTFF